MKILILINDAGGLYNFRKELIIKLKKMHHSVVVAAPESEYKNDIISLGAKYYVVKINRRGMNPYEEISILKQYLSVMKKEKPDKVITYTVKPNIYGGIASRIRGIEYITAIVGLGSIYINNNKFKPFIELLTRIALKKSKYVFFLNNDNKQFYINRRLVRKDQKITVVHGSGVDTSHFKYNKQENKPDIFLFVGRLFKDKGIYELLEAAKIIKNDYCDVQFDIVGFSEDEKTQKAIDEAHDKKLINFHGKHKDIIPFMNNSTCIVLPSYGEGCGTVLQEGAAIGRPLITCDTYGCRDNVKEGINGYLCEVGSSASLAKAMKRIIELPYPAKVEMGLNSRKMAEELFERDGIIDTYIEAILEE